jgi:lysophospholipase L1-like esterase
MALAVFLTALALSGCTPDGVASTLRAQVAGHECAGPTGRKLYVYGDSISHGWDTPSYPGIVACRLGLELVNESIGGTAIDDQNQYPAIMAAQWEPDAVVMFAPGTNDAIIYGQDQTHEEFYRQALSNVIAKIASGGQTGIIGTPLSSCDEQRFGPNSYKNSYAQINRDLVVSAGPGRIHLADYMSAFSPSHQNTHDCLHPNATGNQELAAVAIGAL